MSDESKQIGQGEIEKLLEQARAAQAPPKPPPAASPAFSGSVGQAEIDALLAAAGGSASPSPASQSSAGAANPGVQSQPQFQASAQVAAPTPPRPGSREAGPVASGDLEFLMDQAERALASIHDPNSDEPPGIVPFRLEDFLGAPPSTEAATFELIRDVELDLKIEFGRAQMYLEDVLRLRRGSVVPLDKLAGDPVDIFVNGRLIARGEVLVLNDNFCVRVAELVSGETAAAG